MTRIAAHFSGMTRRMRLSGREIRMLKLGLTITALSTLAVMTIGSMLGLKPARTEPRNSCLSPSSSRMVDPSGNQLTPKQIRHVGCLRPKKWMMRFHFDRLEVDRGSSYGVERASCVDLPCG